MVLLGLRGSGVAWYGDEVQRENAVTSFLPTHSSSFCGGTDTLVRNSITSIKVPKVVK